MSLLPQVAAPRGWVRAGHPISTVEVYLGKGAAEDQLSDSLGGDELLRKAQIDPTDLAETLHLVTSQLKVDAAEVLTELVQGLGSDDGYDYPGLLPQPVESHLRGSPAYRLCKPHNLVGDGQIALVYRPAHVGASGGLGVSGVFAGEHPLPEGAPGGDSQVQGAGHGD